MTTAQYIIHKDSKRCAQSELDLFEPPPTVEQVEKTTCMAYRPSSAISNSSVIEFFIAGTGDEYIDLQETKLHLELVITKSDGTSHSFATDASKLYGPAPVNNFLHSLFSQVDVYFNDKLVSTSNNLYPYRAYLETLLNHGNDSQDSHLTCMMYYPDEPGKMDSSTSLAANKGNVNRMNVAFKNKSGFDLIGSLHSDFFHQNRYLLNNVDVKVRLIRSRIEFCMCALAQTLDAVVTRDIPKIEIKQATLYMHKVKIAPSLMLAQAQQLAHRPARYPFHRVEMKSFSIASGLLSSNRDNLVLGQLPTQVIIGLVDAKAESGDLDKNPFNFQHFHVNHLSLQVGSEQFPSIPLQPDFKNGLYVREYQQLLESLGFWRTDKGVKFDRTSYAQGYTLYGFNLTPNRQQCSEAFNLLKQGNLQLNIKFAQATSTALMVIVYLVYQNMMEIDQARNIVFDYAM
jgi:hypothetical protein